MRAGRVRVLNELSWLTGAVSIEMRMTDPVPTFSYLVSRLAAEIPDLGYIHVVEPGVAGAASVEADGPEVVRLYVCRVQARLAYAHRSRMSSFGRYGSPAPSLQLACSPARAR